MKRLRRKKFVVSVVCVALFLTFAVFMEGRGYLIHKIGYDRGVAWNADDLWFDNAVTCAMYQIVIFALLLAHRNFWVWLGMEAFWVTCTHDLLFFFGIWNGSAFPAGDWTWMPLYPYLGFWNTAAQAVLSAGCLLTVFVFGYLFRYRNPQQ